MIIVKPTNNINTNNNVLVPTYYKTHKVLDCCARLGAIRRIRAGNVKCYLNDTTAC